MSVAVAKGEASVVVRAGGAATTRDGLLVAAAQVLREAGVTGLTLEAVARAAGVSKGGLLYHFASKDALIAALVEDRLARCDEAIDRAMAEDDGPLAGRWLRAYVRLTFAPPSDAFGLTAALLAATTNPALLAPIWAAFDRWQARAIDDGLDPAEATLIRLAADGLWFADLFAAGPPTAALRAGVAEALLRRAGDKSSVVSRRSSGAARRRGGIVPVANLSDDRRLTTDD